MKKNIFLRKIYIDQSIIGYEMKNEEIHFENLFGSLCNHISGNNTVGVLKNELKENNLLFKSKKTGVRYVKVAIKKGFLSKKFNYFFVYTNKKGNIYVAGMFFIYGKINLCAYELSHVTNYGKLCRVIIPITKK